MCQQPHSWNDSEVWAWACEKAPPTTAVLVAIGLIFCAAYTALAPTDIERAETDIKKARAVVIALEDESDEQGKESRGHSQRAAEYREAGNETKAATDETYLEWCDSSAHAHRQLAKAKRARRDNTLHLAAEYRRLLAEAECEILRAKDARDRGTPYKVAPRVREILAPVLGSH